MLAYNPEERPSARGVEILCREIASRLDGPWLRDWSEQAIPGVIARRKPPESDALTGTVIVEHTGTVGFPELSEPGLGSGRLPRVALLLLGGLLLVGGFAAFEAWQAWSEVRARRTVEPRATPVANPVPLPPPSKAPEVASPPPVEPPTPPERVKVHEPSPTPPSVSLPERKAPLSEAPVVRSERKSPTPTPAVKGPGGTVLVRGDATRVWLVSGTKRLSPGEVPAGSYTIMAAFPSTEAAVAGQLTLQANETVTLNCQSSFALCRVTR
jgi:hypothetical protein